MTEDIRIEPRRQGKSLAGIIANMSEEHRRMIVLSSMGDSFKALHDAVEKVRIEQVKAREQIERARPMFVYYDEWCRFDPGSIELLPEKVRDWRPQEQKPPEAIPQKKRAKGVVLMRDRTGKLVERKIGG